MTVRVALPHLGTLYIPAGAYLRALGLEVVVPHFSSRRTLDLGVTHCPEMVCAPCKLLFGNYAEALERGADHVIMFGGPDTCRLGYSVATQVAKLRAMGYDFVAHPFSLRNVAGDILRITRDLADPSPPALLSALRFLRDVLILADQVERAALALRPRQVERGAASRLRREALAQVEALPDPSALAARRAEILAPLLNAPRKRDRPVYRVGLVGDPYTISEPFFNLGLEEKLGRLGVEANHWFWLSDSLRLDPLRFLPGNPAAKARERTVAPYLRRDVGGFARSSLIQAVAFARQGYDGLIHVAPFNCMPEIVVASVMPQLCRDHDPPLLALTFDEHSGDAGLNTRLEAFVDLLERRARRRRPQTTCSSASRPPLSIPFGWRREARR
jgi:predicted nucleotide-binding protein (sugar kinase/HSP70/actin superfamily)